MYSAYIIYSHAINQYYTGHTQDLENRLAEHNQGETSSIKKSIPWKPVWSREFNTRAEAMRLENQIKKRGAKRFLEDLSLGA